MRKDKKKSLEKSLEPVDTNQAFDFGLDFWGNTTPVADNTKTVDIEVDKVDAFSFL